jgi:helicase MOV-10
LLLLTSSTFAVAVTRAQALLIVIGDPTVLSLDPLWRAFLNYVHLNKGWKGDPISWDPKAPVEEAGKYDQAVRDSAGVDMNDFTRMMEAMTLENADATDADVNPEVNVDRPWRDME